MLALLVAALAVGFLTLYGRLRRMFARSGVAEWLQPAIGGLLLGALCTPLIMFLSHHIHQPGQGMGLLGGGYGAVQMAISGVEWLPGGWTAVWMLSALALAKAVAASLTLASGGSAGDFAPSLAIGGLFGGAFGRAAELLLNDPRIQPGAFALVGMGVFYGGIAHVPLSALVLVCELAGNYDLLVPLMLTQGIAFVALRKRGLYHAQVESPRESPAHRDTLLLGVLEGLMVRDVATLGGERPLTFEPNAPLAAMLQRASEHDRQELFPVLSRDGALVGVVTPAALRVAVAQYQDTAWVLAADLMQPPLSVAPDDDLRTAIERMLSAGVHALPVVSGDGALLGLLSEAELTGLYFRLARPADSQSESFSVRR